MKEWNIQVFSFLFLGSSDQVLTYSLCTDTMRRGQSQRLVARVGLNRPVQVPILGGGKLTLTTAPNNCYTSWLLGGGDTPLSSRSPRLSILFCLLWVTPSAICHPGFASSFSCLFFLLQWDSRSLSWMTSSDCKLGMLGLDRLTERQSSGYVCGRVSEIKMKKAVLTVGGGGSATPCAGVLKEKVSWAPALISDPWVQKSRDQLPPTTSSNHEKRNP